MITTYKSEKKLSLGNKLVESVDMMYRQTDIDRQTDVTSYHITLGKVGFTLELANMKRNKVK